MFLLKDAGGHIHQVFSFICYGVSSDNFEIQCLGIVCMLLFFYF